MFLERIAPIKSTYTAMEVVQQADRCLIIAGNVPSEQQAFFHEKVEPNLDGEQIRYMGPVDDAEKNALLGRAGAFPMPIE